MSSRKLKNRVAAQAARDRKKAQVDQLEDELRRLRSENEALKRENSMLYAQQISCSCGANKVTVKVENQECHQPSALTSLVSTSKSAVLSPQQKDRIQALLALVVTSYSLIYLITLR